MWTEPRGGEAHGTGNSVSLRSSVLPLPVLFKQVALLFLPTLNLSKIYTLGRVKNVLLITQLFYYVALV